MFRRGHPKQSFTDIGTNFVGAEFELREWVQSLDQMLNLNYLTSKGVSWKLNSPFASHMQSIWERIVRSMKPALKITLRNMYPKEEVLSTVPSKKEYTLNSRTSTHLSVDNTNQKQSRQINSSSSDQVVAGATIKMKSSALQLKAVANG